MLPLLTLFLGLLLLLDLLQGVDTICQSVGGVEVVGDLLATNQAEDNASTDDEGEDEAVHGVPRRSPAFNSGASVGVVEEGECQELRDQGIFDGKEKGWPRNGGCDHTDRVPAVASASAIFGPLKTPVDGTEE